MHYSIAAIEMMKEYLTERFRDNHMIVITKVEWRRVPDLKKCVIRAFGTRTDDYRSFLEGQSRQETLTCVDEIVHGRRYVHPKKGIDVVIGCTKEAQEAIGIQYEAYEALQQEAAKNRENATAWRKMANTWEEDVKLAEARVASLEKALKRSRIETVVALLVFGVAGGIMFLLNM